MLCIFQVYYSASAGMMASDWNWAGEGYILGGIMVLSRQGEIIYSFKEETPGAKPNMQDIIDACLSQMPMSPEDSGKKYFLSFNG